MGVLRVRHKSVECVKKPGVSLLWRCYIKNPPARTL